MKKAISNILWELIPHENKYIITEKDILDYITNLQQENERLKEKVKHYEETQTFGDYVEEVNLLVDYKSRIEKAVEYIEKHRKVYKLGVNQETDEFDYISTSPQELLNILNGRCDE